MPGSGVTNYGFSIFSFLNDFDRVQPLVTLNSVPYLPSLTVTVKLANGKTQLIGEKTFVVPSGLLRFPIVVFYPFIFSSFRTSFAGLNIDLVSRCEVALRRRRQQ